MIIIKYDLYPILIEELKVMYGISDLENLYSYLYIRATINYKKKNLNNMELLKFIFEELNISLFDNTYVFYENEKYQLINLQTEIVDNLKFQAKVDNSNLLVILSEVYRKGYNRALKFKKLNNYNVYTKYHKLKSLNEYYKARVTSPNPIIGFTYLDNHNPFKRSLEEQIEGIINFDNLLSYNTTNISEEVLEDYVVENIHLIEEEMQYLGRQIRVENGIIDILANDKDNNLCIIEVKINEDKKILWQSLYYQKMIKERYKKRNIRMIVIAPSFNSHMIDALREVENVEMLEYDIRISMGKIEGLFINKVNTLK